MSGLVKSTSRVVIGGRQLAATLALIGCAMSGAVADDFRRLSGSQIRTALAGMEISDGVHWRQVQDRDGTLRIYSIGRSTVGKWLIEKNENRFDFSPPEGGCFEVWLSGKNVKLKPTGLGLAFEGVVEVPSEGK